MRAYHPYGPPPSDGRWQADPRGGDAAAHSHWGDTQMWLTAACIWRISWPPGRRCSLARRRFSSRGTRRAGRGASAGPARWHQAFGRRVRRPEVRRKRPVAADAHPHDSRAQRDEVDAARSESIASGRTSPRTTSSSPSARSTVWTIPSGLGRSPQHDANPPPRTLNPITNTTGTHS